LDEREKIDLETAIYVMIDFGLEILQEGQQVYDREHQAFVVSEYNPHIERLLLFPVSSRGIENKF